MLIHYTTNGGKLQEALQKVHKLRIAREDLGYAESKGNTKQTGKIMVAPEHCGWYNAIVNNNSRIAAFSMI